LKLYVVPAGPAATVIHHVGIAHVGCVGTAVGAAGIASPATVNVSLIPFVTHPGADTTMSHLIRVVGSPAAVDHVIATGGCVVVAVPICTQAPDPTCFMIFTVEPAGTLLLTRRL